MRKKTIAVIALLCVILCACSPNADNTTDPSTSPLRSCPPESLLYLGGAAILNEFTVTGGPSDAGGQKDIVVFVPFTLVKDGFYFAIVGEKDDGTQTILATQDDLEPGSYLKITEDQYTDFDSFSLTMDYTWEGTLMSMRTINLFTMEEQSSVTQEFEETD